MIVHKQLHTLRFDVLCFSIQIARTLFTKHTHLVPRFIEEVFADVSMLEPLVRDSVASLSKPAHTNYRLGAFTIVTYPDGTSMTR